MGRSARGCADAELGWWLGFLNHDFGGFDDGADGVADFQFQFLGAGAGDDAFDEIVADLDGDVGQYVTELDFRDFADEAVAG